MNKEFKELLLAMAGTFSKNMSLKMRLLRALKFLGGKSFAEYSEELHDIYHAHNGNIPLTTLLQIVNDNFPDA